MMRLLIMQKNIFRKKPADFWPVLRPKREEKSKKVYFLENKDHAEDHFTLDPRDQMNAIKDMRANGLKPLGNWHSHPSSPSRPSVEDIRLAFDSKASYLILSLIADYPVLNSFHIENGEWTKEDLRIYSEEYYF